MDIPRYKIERELGRGGMAIVYLARQIPLGRPVALKVMAPALVADKSFPKRFLEEGRIIAQLDHPNIVTVFDLDTHSGIYYLSMEYISGGTLEQRIGQGLSVEDTVRIIINIAKALGYAHSRGIVHRDIKPQNILFRKDGSPVLTDFGIARFVDSKTQLTAPGLTMGSPLYISPERVTGKKADGRSDLYSLGVLFYQMLTAKMPYEADSAVAIVMMHCTAPLPVLPRSFKRFQPILGKLLAKNPNDRFNSAEELIQALQVTESYLPRRGTETDRTANVPTQLALPDTSQSAWLTVSLIRKGLAAGVLLTVTGIGYYLISTDSFLPGPEKLFADAEDFYAGGKYQESLNRIEEISRLAPDYPGLNALKHEVQGASAKRQAEKLFADAKGLYAEGKYQESLNLIDQITRLILNYPGLNAFKQQVQEALALQKKNSELLAKAQGERSYELFLQVLKMDPNNTDAKVGLKAIGDNYYRRAKQFLDQGQMEDSQKLLDELSQFLPDYPSLPALQQQVKEGLTKQGEVQALLAWAEQQLNDQKFVTPNGDNAYDSYQKVLELEKENPKALEGLTAIANKYYQIRAQRLFEENKLPDCLNLIEEGLKKFPGHVSLQTLRNEVQNAWSHEQQANAMLNEAQNLFKVGKLEDSLKHIEKGLLVIADHPELRQLKQEVEQRINVTNARLVEIQKLLDQAQEQLNKDKLDDARESYRKVLVKDNKNQEAQDGLQTIANKYQKRVEELIADKKLKEAREIINKGLMAVKNHKELLALQEKVSKQIISYTPKPPDPKPPKPVGPRNPQGMLVKPNPPPKPPTDPPNKPLTPKPPVHTSPPIEVTPTSPSGETVKPRGSEMTKGGATF